MALVSGRASSPDVNDYDRFAAAYTAHNEGNAWNAYYERPAVIAMVGDVAGARVLDVGCGAGSHSVALADRGAKVTGFDKSRGLLAIARERLGERVELHHGDLADPLPFDDGAFDVVLASLVLHYLRDWAPVLEELHRVLVPGGRLIVSTHHPFMDHVLSGEDDYFATYLITDEWTLGDEQVTMQFWHRPLRDMLAAFTSAGFVLDRIHEPEPDPKAELLFPQAFESLTTKPQFLFFEARRP